MAGLSRAVRRLPDRPAFVATIAGLAAVLFIGALLLRDDSDPSKLVHAAPPWTDVRAAPGSLTVQPAERDSTANSSTGSPFRPCRPDAPWPVFDSI